MVQNKQKIVFKADFGLLGPFGHLKMNRKRFKKAGKWAKCIG
jgi:hypothetical protein